jgi:hypothetical protein
VVRARAHRRASAREKEKRREKRKKTQADGQAGSAAGIGPSFVNAGTVRNARRFPPRATEREVSRGRAAGRETSSRTKGKKRKERPRVSTRAFTTKKAKRSRLFTSSSVVRRGSDSPRKRAVGCRETKRNESLFETREKNRIKSIPNSTFGNSPLRPVSSRSRDRDGGHDRRATTRGAPREEIKG